MFEQVANPCELARRGRLDPARADPPGRVDLEPAVLEVVDPRSDDGYALAFRRHGDSRASLRDDLHDECAADPVVAVRHKLVAVAVGPEQDVNVAVVLLELDALDDAAGDATAALHLQPVRVVDARERFAAAAVRRRRRRRASERAAGEDEREEEECGRPAHVPSLPTRPGARKTSSGPCLPWAFVAPRPATDCA